MIGALAARNNLRVKNARQPVEDNSVANEALKNEAQTKPITCPISKVY